MWCIMLITLDCVGLLQQSLTCNRIMVFISIKSQVQFKDYPCSLFVLDIHKSAVNMQYEDHPSCSPLPYLVVYVLCNDAVNMRASAPAQPEPSWQSLSKLIINRRENIKHPRSVEPCAPQQ